MLTAGVLIRAAAVSRPLRVQVCTFGRHFAVLTINLALGHSWDHLFLVREGWPKWKSGKFKVVILGSVFETGTMTGLMTTFQ